MNNKLCCVSGYWQVKNKHENSFDSWFKNTLNVNHPYIFFCNENIIDNIKFYRNNFPTHFLNYDLNNFLTNALPFRDDITHPLHCPSIELSKIWHEKMNLLDIASKLNPYNSEWFFWIDAGMCSLRNSDRTFEFKNLDKLDKLDIDKFHYTKSVVNPTFSYENIKRGIYTHEISGTYLIHKNMIGKFKDLYYQYLYLTLNNIDKLQEKYFAASDQCIWSLIYVNHPELFNKIGDGYGEIINYL